MNKNIFNRSIAVLSLMLLATTLNTDNISVCAEENTITGSAVSSTSSSDKIMAIVEGVPITTADFRTAKKLIKFMSHWKRSEDPSQYWLNLHTYTFLLDTHTAIEWARKHNIVVSDAEIDRTINKIERLAKIPEKYIETVTKAEGIYDQHRRLICKDILLEQISRSMVNLDSNAAMPTVDYLVISSRNNRANYNKMLNLRSKINCKSTNQQFVSFAQIKRINTSIKDVDVKIKDIIDDLQPGENKIITDDNTKTIQCIHLCAREEEKTNYDRKIIQKLSQEVSIQILLPLCSEELVGLLD